MVLLENTTLTGETHVTTVKLSLPTTMVPLVQVGVVFNLVKLELVGVLLTGTSESLALLCCLNFF